MPRVFDATTGGYVYKEAVVDAQGAFVSAKRSLKTTVVGAITYIADAPAGTLQATAAWNVQKIDTTIGTVITWADSGNSSQVATDLTALIYS